MDFTDDDRKCIRKIVRELLANEQGAQARNNIIDVKINLAISKYLELDIPQYKVPDINQLLQTFVPPTEDEVFLTQLEEEQLDKWATKIAAKWKSINGLAISVPTKKKIWHQQLRYLHKLCGAKSLGMTNYLTHAERFLSRLSVQSRRSMEADKFS